MIKDEIKITVVIPLRADINHLDILDRLEFVSMDPSYIENVTVIVVDDGSDREASNAINALCLKMDFEYVHLDTSDKIFSIGRCRNVGAKLAKTRYVFFQDVDLIPPQGFYRKLAEEIEIVGLHEHNNNMIMIPVGYFTKNATLEYLADSNARNLQLNTDRIIHRDTTYFEKYSSGTSACLYDRYYYLSCGGNIEEFSGWGFEDLEFNTRVILDSNRYPTPNDWISDISSFDRQSEFKGWKSAYRLFGDRSFLKGLILFHAWHPVEPSSQYYRQKEINRKRFISSQLNFRKTRVHPNPIVSKERGSTLIFRKNAFTFSRDLQPLLGETTLTDEHQFKSKAEFCRFFISGGYSRILFHNPYVNNAMRQIYQWTREEKLPFIVAERGALNGSVLFDPTGFLADSKMFDAELWNKDIAPEQVKRVSEYIEKEQSHGLMLESQGKRISLESLTEKLQISDGDKVTLICLQRPSDTATQFFSSEFGDYDKFLKSLKLLADQLPDDHKLLVKTHPLEDVSPNISAQDVSDLHLYDLFRVANQLVVFNSGTGVQAMLWGLPVITCGKAFYDHPLLTQHVENFAELRNALMREIAVNEQARLRFLCYLLNDYYSFGQFYTRQSKLTGGERITATLKIMYEKLKFDGIELRFQRSDKIEDNWKSMLFDRYLWMHGEYRRLNKPNTHQTQNIALKIYGFSRGIPILEQTVNLFVPLYRKLVCFLGK